jgi:L-iditol 2-dehydrogenase
VKAVLYHPPRTLRCQEVTTPGAGPGEVVVRIRSVGLCGTDIHKIVSQGVPAGTVLGHEISGTVAEVGKGVTGFCVGDRVYGGHHVPCFTCQRCRRGHHSLCAQFKATNFDPGGFAEYVRLSALHVTHNLWKLPEGATFDQGAMVEPVATVVRGMQRLRVLPGDSALVMGAGPIGCVWIQALRFMGADTILVSDVVEERLRAARALGATEVIDIGRASLRDSVRSLTEGEGVDVVVIAAGVSALLEEAVAVAAPGGQVLAFATLGSARLDAGRFFSEISVLGAYSSVPMDYATSMALISRGTIQVDSLITHHFPLEQLAAAVDLATSPSSPALKIMLHPEE